jgi:hypothetical protein
MENFEDFKNTINENMRKQAEADAEQGTKEEVENLPPQEKLKRWKTLQPDHFDALSSEDKAALIKEYNELIDQVSNLGEIAEPKVINEDDFKSRLNKAFNPDLDTLRKLATKAETQDNTREAKVVAGAIQDFADSFKPLLSRLDLRQDQRLSELLNRDEIGHISFSLTKLSNLDFAKPESLSEAIRWLRGITGSLELIGKSPQIGPLRENLDNLDYLAWALRKISEQSGNLSHHFKRMNTPESGKAGVAAARLADLATDKGKYCWARKDLLSRR